MSRFRLSSYVFLAFILSLLFLSLTPFISAQDDDDTEVTDTDDFPSPPSPPSPPAEKEEEIPKLFTDEQEAAIKEKSEAFEFQAEVSRLMDIIINSLYSKREIFIRELISNSADALDKIRFLALTNQTTLGADDKLDIKIAFDRKAKTITLTDSGVGMTKDQLKTNLGVVAKSGTSDFLDAVAKGTDGGLSLIGQFGVGFYSVYLVADKVTVISKHYSPESEQYIWESSAERTFTVSPDPRGNTLGRGTSIILHMKSDSEEFINEHEIKKLVERYSEFINYPIYLWLSKMVDKEEEVPVVSETVEEPKAEGEDDDTVEVTEVVEEEEKPKINLDKVEKWTWQRLNEVKAIWTRAPSDISDDEYTAFYKALTKDEKEPLAHTHFTAEGEITFRAILYVPKNPPPNMYDKFYDKSTALKLYVRRVLITDEFDDFLPRYLNFIKGVVDSDDLPLNVSRETLAQSRVLKVMAKKLTRKVLEMLKKLSDANKTSRANGEDSDHENDDYNIFWKNYGKSIKLGIIDDRANKAKLSKLLRYTTSKSEGKLISLDEYVDRMKPTQKFIYYITGESIDSVSKSPFAEKLLKKDLEVVYMVDPVDEYLLQPLTEYDGTQFMSVTKEGLKIDESEEAKLEKHKEEFKPLTSWLQSTLGSDRVTKVTVSNRIASSPMIIVTGQYGWTANMERIMSGQTFANTRDTSHLKSKKTLEINPFHPLIRELKERVEKDPEETQLKEVTELLWDACLLQSGFMMDKPDDFAKRIHRVTSLTLGVDPAAPLIEDEEDSAPAEEAETGDTSEHVHEEL